MTSHRVAVAAEAFAASLFARAGCDVLVQYGPNQPGYDLVAARDGVTMRVSVKGSNKSGWGLLQSYKKGRTYAEAANTWLQDQREDVVFCLVCFKGKNLHESPLAFLATPREIAEQLKSGKHGTGVSVLYVNYIPTKGIGKDYMHKIPNEWEFTQPRVDALFGERQATRKTQLKT